MEFLEVDIASLFFSKLVGKLNKNRLIKDELAGVSNVQRILRLGICWVIRVIPFNHFENETSEGNFPCTMFAPCFLE